MKQVGRSLCDIRTRKGFTLIELLVVLSIVSFLSAIVLASLNASRAKARVATTVTQLREIEKALHLLALEQNRATWWEPSDFPGATLKAENILKLEDFIRDYGLGKYLRVAPLPAAGTHYAYRNTGTTFVCGGQTWRGVTISIRNMSDMDLFAGIDQLIDDGDGPGCGRTRMSGSGFYYQLGVNLLDLPL